MWEWVKHFLQVTGWCFLGIPCVCVKLDLLRRNRTCGYFWDYLLCKSHLVCFLYECLYLTCAGLNEWSFSGRIPTDGPSLCYGSIVTESMSCFLKNSVLMFARFCCSSVAMEGEVSHVTQTHPISAFWKRMSNSFSFSPPHPASHTSFLPLFLSISYSLFPPSSSSLTYKSQWRLYTGLHQGMLLTGYGMVEGASQLCSCIVRHFIVCKGGVVVTYLWLNNFLVASVMHVHQ